MRILITGAAGFVARHLTEYVIEKPDTILYGTARDKKQLDDGNNRLTLLMGDLRDKKTVMRILKTSMPDKIFHLAASALVSTSWRAPQDILAHNVLPALNIFDAARELGINPIIILAGSCEEYGLIKRKDLPAKETHPLYPLSPYAVSKMTQEAFGFQYHKNYGLKTVLLRFSNTAGPGMNEELSLSNFAKQIAEIETGRREPIIYVGNLNVKKDFIDVRDAVKAYWLASERCEYGEAYNICSQTPQSIKEALHTLLSLSPKKRIHIEAEPLRMRPSNTPIFFGDYTKFKKKTGWKPIIPLKKTMEDLLNYWRERV